ncbi:sensor histidine kinase [Parasediminibacterium sp. JCM 36343]|uniref:sensor histidine kinase n=1 Tax=Parasediminibacterium sp. JCM 36343 TaxID=3374279 RepID=UPI003977E7E9
MKLFSRYNRINIGASILVFLAGCLAFYFVLHYVLLRQLDKTLQSEQSEIVQYIKEHNQLPEIVNTSDQKTAFTKTNAPFQETQFATQMVWEEKEQENIWLRVLSFHVAVAGQHYKVTVTKSQEETEYLIQVIVLIAIGMIGVIIIVGLIINRIVLKKLWQPFYNTIHLITQYKLASHQSLVLPDSTIDEFALLNKSLANMAGKIEQEYATLKAFTSNAAHEMQTPLAVIASRAETLMQDDAVLQNHHASIATIEQSVNKLSRLNQSLLLLAKIENHFFELTETILWDELIKQKIEEVAELNSSNQIKTTIDVVPVAAVFNLHLADIIITNLFNNAIRYNVAGGAIDIALTANYLVIGNTSSLPALDIQKIGSRFYRHPQTTQPGNGLGLSIVQQVCAIAGYKLQYSYIDSMHCFKVCFE